ncbi:hypothetical protein L7F22_029782 [Adiantum nelumboides]|nr:hypothetical protein [Adiantum nelumboides]
MDKNIASSIVVPPTSSGCSELLQFHLNTSVNCIRSVPVSPKLSLRHITKSSISHGDLQQKLWPLITNALFPSLRSPQKNQVQPSAIPVQPKKEPLKLSERWREIQGENNWEGLLDHPIDATLRSEIMRYGEFAQICYDAFDFNEHSLYCGSCKYNKGSLFEKVDKGQCGYEVTKYLYATSKLNLPKFFQKSVRDEEKRWSRVSNWIGYVAVCVDDEEIRRLGRRDILVAWRGTVTKTEWAEDLRAMQTPANIEQKHVVHVNIADEGANRSALALLSAQVPRGWTQWMKNGDNLREIVKVETGFLSLYSSSKANSRFNKLSAGQQMAMEVKRLLEKYEGEEMSITVTGHSLGAALALLCAYDVAVNVVSPLDVAEMAAVPGAGSSPISLTESVSPTKAVGSNRVMITVFAFAGPRVGNRAWKRAVEEAGVRVLRVVNVHDCVPKVPGFLINEGWPDASNMVSDSYHHVGKELLIDMDYSPQLRRTRDLPCHHNLEAHLHVLDGFHGFDYPFESVFGRSPVLVNKSSDFLIKEAHIPPSWWQESNKGLVKDPSSGQWVLASREEGHLPEPHN